MKTTTITVLILTLFGSAVEAQEVVPVAAEPTHRLMLETEWFQVLDPLLMPGDTTLFHLHDSPIHYVMISPSPANAQVLGQAWPEGSADQLTRAVGEGWWTLEYADSPVVHRVTNIGTTPFRLIAVTHLDGPRSAGRSGEVPAPARLPGVIEAESAWFVRARLRVEPGRTVSVPGGRDPVVMIQVSAGRVEVSGDGGLERATDSVGGWVVLASGGRHELHSSSTEDVTVVLVQVVTG